jgi:hypothetical protein
MERSGSTVVRFVVGTAVLLLLGVTVIFGPRLYRAVRAVVSPVVDLTRVEERLAALNEEFAYAPDPQDAIDETRLEQFLAIRRELKPRYEAWDAAVEAAEQQGESWQTVTSMLTLTRDVLHAQIDALTRARMSPAEFRALEETVYEGWLDRVDPAADPSSRAIRELTEQDLAFVGELIERYGRSAPLAAVERRLQGRVAEPAAGMANGSQEGGGDPTHEMLSRHRDDIAALRLRQHPMHSAILEADSGGIDIHIDNRSDGVNVEVSDNR